MNEEARERIFVAQFHPIEIVVAPNDAKQSAPPTRSN